MNLPDSDECKAGCACCLLVAQAISRIGYKNLFSKPYIERENASLNDVSNMVNYAVTVNIQPTKLMNKRPWRKYSNVQQVSQLTRIERALRDKNPSIQLVEMHFETCPKLKQMHFHALYSMPPEFKIQLETYYLKYTSTDAKTIEPWRTLDIQEVHDKEGWLKYIRKTI